MTLDEFKIACGQLVAEGPAQIAAASTLDEWKAVRDGLVGRASGRLKDIMGALPKLPAEDRRTAGLLGLNPRRQVYTNCVPIIYKLFTTAGLSLVHPKTALPPLPRFTLH